MATQEMLATIKNAQLKHAGQMALDAVEYGYSDDGYDYLRGALELARILVDWDYDGAVDAFERMLRDESDDTLCGIACDGICNEIWDLKPACLMEDE